MMKTNSMPIPNSDIVIGGGSFTLIAGPCSIESVELLSEMGPHLAESHVNIFRGGIHKMRTSPQNFQGAGFDILDPLLEFKRKFHLPIISEITDLRHIEKYSAVVDIFQVGSRNMYNYALLKELGKTKKPILLKRAFSATIQEWLSAAEYIEKSGNTNIIFCERGIRTFETTLRNTLDLGAVAYLKLKTKYPVIVDPSHGSGMRDLVIPLSLAAKAVGADGVMVECHPRPQEALSDSEQTIDLKQLQILSNLLSKT